MPRACGHCQSTDTEAECDRYFCFQCGRTTDLYGNGIPPDPQWLAPNWGGPEKP